MTAPLIYCIEGCEQYRNVRNCDDKCMSLRMGGNIEGKRTNDTRSRRP
jgi:hypothetical protein